MSLRMTQAYHFHFPHLFCIEAMNWIWGEKKFYRITNLICVNRECIEQLLLASGVEFRSKI